MNVYRLCHVAIVLLAALACIPPALCGPIHDAAKAGDLATVKALLRDNPDLVFSKNDGLTPLHFAACYGRKDMVELLLASKAEVDARANDGRTPLHYAAIYGHKEVAQSLLATKADVNAADGDGLRPLHFAASYGLRDVAELLLAGGADLNAKANNGMTPLQMGAEWGHKDVAELLRRHGGQDPVGAHEPPPGNSMASAPASPQTETGEIHDAAKAGTSQTTDYDGQPFAGNKSELVTVHVDMNLGFVYVTDAFLFDEGAVVLPNITPRGKSIPRCAQPAEYCVIDHVGSVIKYPLSKGHIMLGNEVDTWGQFMTGNATWLRFPGKLKLVLYLNAHLGSRVNSGSASSEEVDALAGSDQFFNVEWARTPGGTTIELKRWRMRLGRNSRPASASDSLVRIVELGDVNALHDRLSKGSKGSDPNTSDPGAIPAVIGWTPLMAAAESGQTEIVKILLDAGVPVNQRTSVGDTPLIEAASDGNADVLAVKVRFAAPNSGAPLTDPGRSAERLLRRAKGPSRNARHRRGHFAAIMAPFPTAINMRKHRGQE